MNRPSQAAGRPAATAALFALVVAVFNWPLLGAPMGLGSLGRCTALFGLWALAIALIATHTVLTPRASPPDPPKESDA